MSRVVIPDQRRRRSRWWEVLRGVFVGCEKKLAKLAGATGAD